MGGMACCPSNHRNRKNIYDRAPELFKRDVVNSEQDEPPGGAWYVPPGVCGWIDGRRFVCSGQRTALTHSAVRNLPHPTKLTLSHHTRRMGPFQREALFKAH